MTRPAENTTSRRRVFPERLLTQTEVADRLQLSVRTLEAMRLRGGGPPFLKVGRLVRYAPADLKGWLASARRCSTSDPGAAVPERLRVIGSPDETAL